MVDAAARFAIQNRHPLDGAAHALRHLSGQRQRAMGDQHGELLPTQPIGGDPLLAGIAQPFAEGAQYLIAEQVPIFVVEVLEAIDIGEDQREGVLAADQPLQLQIEGAAVEQVGEGILVGQFACLVERGPQLFDLFLRIAELVAKVHGGHAHIPRFAHQLPQDPHGVFQAEALVINAAELVKTLVEHLLKHAGIGDGVLHGVA